SSTRTSTWRCRCCCSRACCSSSATCWPTSPWRGWTHASAMTDRGEGRAAGDRAGEYRPDAHPEPRPARVRESRTPLELAWRRFKRSRVGIFGGIVLIVLYLTALFSQFLAPYSITRQYPAVYQPPQRLHFVHEGKLSWPF